ncbi:MAG: DUF1697 domain-containing protein, partial [Pseudomonadota bacterium]|nr:DUF1697 domain-containing protein [Pseudomonadota bacterium]
MTRHVALLRAVNVAGTGKIAMADLRAFMEGLGFGNVRTLIQSGNLVFETPGEGGVKLEAILEAEAAARLGLATSFILRTPREWKAA